MSPVSKVQNHTGRFGAEFPDHIIRITHAYLRLRAKKSHPTAALIVLAAEECGWRITANGHIAELVESIAKASLYSTPLIREKQWNNQTTASALNEWV